jgi:hypothetical protein
MTTKVQKKQLQQKFIRITLDSKLQLITDRYSEDYPLLGQSEILKMLICNGLKKEKNTFKQILANSQFADVIDEDEQFQILKQNDL